MTQHRLQLLQLVVQRLSRGELQLEATGTERSARSSRPGRLCAGRKPLSSASTEPPPNARDHSRGKAANATGAADADAPRTSLDVAANLNPSPASPRPIDTPPPATQTAAHT